METSPEGNMAPQRSWWSRNWKWAVPVGCMGLLASCGCLAVLAGFFGWRTITNNPAAEQAMEIVRADSEVQATLGTPIESDPWKQQSSVSYNNGQKTANYRIQLDGPKADGVLHLEAVELNGKWLYRVLQVLVPGQEPIDLRDKVELAPPMPDAPPPEPSTGHRHRFDDD